MRPGGRRRADRRRAPRPAARGCGARTSGTTAPVALLGRFGGDPPEPVELRGRRGDVGALGADGRHESEPRGTAFGPLLHGPLHPGQLSHSEEDGHAAPRLAPHRSEPTHDGVPTVRREESLRANAGSVEKDDLLARAHPGDPEVARLRVREDDPLPRLQAGSGDENPRGRAHGRTESVPSHSPSEASRRGRSPAPTRSRRNSSSLATSCPAVTRRPPGRTRAARPGRSGPTSS